MGDRYTIIKMLYEPAAYYDNGNWLEDLVVLTRLNEQQDELTTLRQQLAAAEAENLMLQETISTAKKYFDRMGDGWNDGCG